MSKFSFGKTTKTQLEGINPILKDLAYKVLEKTTIDFGVLAGGGHRTTTEQHQYFLDGKSKCDGVKNKSYHQSGNAIDLVTFIDGKFTWESKDAFRELHKVVEEVWKEMNITDWSIEWGGDWGWDFPHYQIKTKIK